MRLIPSPSAVVKEIGQTNRIGVCVCPSVCNLMTEPFYVWTQHLVGMQLGNISDMLCGLGHRSNSKKVRGLRNVTLGQFYSFILGYGPFLRIGFTILSMKVFYGPHPPTL